MARKIVLHVYWDDNMTIELRYFPTKSCARQYVKDNGIENYLID